jgi:copper chaperone for superoxide dismutase
MLTDMAPGLPSHPDVEANVRPGAAVSILESFHDIDETAGAAKETPDDGVKREVRGLARMVQTSPHTTLVDLTLRGVAPGEYRATVRQSGDLSRGASSTGGVWTGTTGAAEDGGKANGGTTQPKGLLGTFTVGKDGRGAVYINHAFQIWEIIGHGMVVTRQSDEAGAALRNDRDTVVGVIARSAGMWDNDKTVCSCTGKTLWEERKDEVQKGML